MKDVNGALRKKVFELLNGAITISSNVIPVYNDYIPNVVTSPYYILLTTISNTERPTKTSTITNTTIQISIFTKDTIANPGKIRDDIAAQVYALLYPSTNSKIDLEPEFQVVFMRLQGDNSLSPFQTNTAIYLNRYITFTLAVYHRQTIASA